MSLTPREKAVVERTRALDRAEKALRAVATAHAQSIFTPANMAPAMIALADPADTEASRDALKEYILAALYDPMTGAGAGARRAAQAAGRAFAAKVAK